MSMCTNIFTTVFKSCYGDDILGVNLPYMPFYSIFKSNILNHLMFPEVQL